MEGIFREPTANDKAFFDHDLNKPKRKKTAQERFEIELKKQEAKATKEGKPFARHVAREDFKVGLNSQIQGQLREFGHIEYPEKIKIPEMDWNKYSDVKNFEVIESGERADPELSKHNPGLNIRLAKTKYKFKGWAQTYTVMESAESAIDRAQIKLAKSRQVK